MRYVGQMNPYLTVSVVEYKTALMPLGAQDQHADPQRYAEISSNMTQMFKIKPRVSFTLSPTPPSLCERLCEAAAAELDLPELF